MSQVKIYALRETIEGKQQAFSDAIHICVMEVLGLPKEKRAHSPETWGFRGLHGDKAALPYQVKR